jgi:hypothetical protein
MLNPVIFLIEDLVLGTLLDEFLIRHMSHWIDISSSNILSYFLI